ncbi:MAG: hypothetical protein ACM3OA_02945 [Acidobacteriota bacterium]
MPRGWMDVMRAATEASIWRFSTARMLLEYVDQLYLPTARRLVMVP